MVISSVCQNIFCDALMPCPTVRLESHLMILLSLWHLMCFCRIITMVIQFSVLIVLHSCLILVTTAEDYKCLPLVLRKACCWINETYAARNVIIFVSILINFLAAMINIVSSISTSRLFFKSECLQSRC